MPAPKALGTYLLQFGTYLLSFFPGLPQLCGRREYLSVNSGLVMGYDHPMLKGRPTLIIIIEGHLAFRHSMLSTSHSTQNLSFNI